MALFYKKLYQPIKDTLEEDYPDLNPKLIGDGKNNVGLKLVHILKTQNGLKLKTTHSRDPNSNFTTLLEPELKISKYNLTCEGKLGTDRKFQGTLSLVDLGTKGSKFFVRGLSEEGKLSGEFGFEFKNNSLSVNSTITKPFVGNFRGLGAGVYKYESYSVGGDVEFDQEKITRYSAKAQIDKSDSTFCVFLNDTLVPKKDTDKPKKEVGFGYFHKLRTDLKGAVDFKVDNNFETEIRAGSDYQVDNSTNFMSRFFLKRREFRLGLVYKQKLTPTTKLKIGTDINTRSFFGTTDSKTNEHRFNISFTCGE
jgi:hypothetical protein